MYQLTHRQLSPYLDTAAKPKTLPPCGPVRRPHHSPLRRRHLGLRLCWRPYLLDHLHLQAEEEARRLAAKRLSLHGI